LNNKGTFFVISLYKDYLNSKSIIERWRIKIVLDYFVYILWERKYRKEFEIKFIINNPDKDILWSSEAIWKKISKEYWDENNVLQTFTLEKDEENDVLTNLFLNLKNFVENRRNNTSKYYNYLNIAKRCTEEIYTKYRIEMKKINIKLDKDDELKTCIDNKINNEKIRKESINENMLFHKNNIINIFSGDYEENYVEINNDIIQNENNWLKNIYEKIKYHGSNLIYYFDREEEEEEEEENIDEALKDLWKTMENHIDYFYELTNIQSLNDLNKKIEQLKVEIKKKREEILKNKEELILINKQKLINKEKELIERERKLIEKQKKKLIKKKKKEEEYLLRKKNREENKNEIVEEEEEYSSDDTDSINSDYSSINSIKDEQKLDEQNSTKSGKRRMLYTSIRPSTTIRRSSKLLNAYLKIPELFSNKNKKNLEHKIEENKNIENIENIENIDEDEKILKLLNYKDYSELFSANDFIEEKSEISNFEENILKLFDHFLIIEEKEMKEKIKQLIIICTLIKIINQKIEGSNILLNTNLYD
ncbi:hypothetical protein Mgra_00001437, partial [Meloidogyne graminicola]